MIKELTLVDKDERVVMSSRAKGKTFIKPFAEKCPDGRIFLGNGMLRVLLDPEDGAAASSICLSPDGMEIARCDSYEKKHFKAFREALHLQRIKEGRIEPPHGEVFQLTDVQVTDVSATAVFEGFLFDGREKNVEDAAAFSALRLVKRYTLAVDTLALNLELTLHNGSGKPLPVALWIISGHRIAGEDVDCYAPTSRGVESLPAPWTKGASTQLIVPRAAAPWTGIVARDQERTGLSLVAAPTDVDTVHDWIGKFAGLNLGFGTPLREIPSGGSYDLCYDLVIHRGLPRLDGVVREVACAIDVPATVAVGEDFSVGVHVCAPRQIEIITEVFLRPFPVGEKAPVGRRGFSLQPGTAEFGEWKVLASGRGTLLVVAEIRRPDGRILLKVERPITVGDGGMRYRRSLPDLHGDCYWSRNFEKSLPAWTQECVRDAGFPMIPWKTPPSGGPLRLLMMGRVGHTTGILRELARRAGASWDLVNLLGIKSSGIFRRFAGAYDGLYGMGEVRAILDRLVDDPPEVLFSAGIQFENIPDIVIDTILDRVRAGMGLVMVWEPGDFGPGPWAEILRPPEAEEVEEEVTGPLRAVFDAGLAPPGLGEVSCYRLGAGRVVTVRLEVLIGRKDSVRNNLLPQIRGRTALPDWEYYFAFHLRAIRQASGRTHGSTILGARVASTLLEVDLCNRSAASREVSLVVEIASTDLLRATRFCEPFHLPLGKKTVRVPFLEEPAHEVVVHLFLLDGVHREAHHLLPVGENGFFREAQPLPVLDFHVAVADLPGPVRVSALEVDTDDAIQEIRATVVLASGHGSGSLRLIAEVRNGSIDRVVWREVRGLVLSPGDQRIVVFQPGKLPLLEPEGIIVIRIENEERMLTFRAVPYRVWIPGNLAEDDVLYLATTGTQGDWFGTRIAKRWAVDEAAFDAHFYRRGDLGYYFFNTANRAFPWRRLRDNILSPPIVSEGPLRQELAEALRSAFERYGATYFCLSDEFRLDGEFDRSPETLAAFRRHLKECHGDVAVLNKLWGSDFSSFDEVVPLLFEEICDTPENLAAWMDFRLFMDRLITRRVEVAAEEASAVSPCIRVGESGMYAPSYDVGCHFYGLTRAAGFMMTYTGLRAAWTRAFLRRDAIAGVWLGYGWQQEHHPWEVLFDGYRILAWWGLMPSDGLARMGVIRPDLTLAKNYRGIGEAQREIRRGIGKLLTGASPATPRVFIPYSQVSAYTANVLERNYEDPSALILGLLSAEGIAASFLADEESAAGGRPEGLAEELFVFPGIDAMPEESAEAYARAIGRGAYALADAEVAWRDGHGRRLDGTGPLEDAFGIERCGAVSRTEAEEETIFWTKDAPERLRVCDGRMARALDGLVMGTAGIPWACFRDGTPAIVSCQNGGGLAIFLNTRFEWLGTHVGERGVLPEDCPDQLLASETLRTLVQVLCAEAGIVPEVAVSPATRHPEKISSFASGSSRFHGFIFRESVGGTVCFDFGDCAHTYDVRRGKYCGNVSKVTETLFPGLTIRVYARFPYRVAGIEAMIVGEIEPGKPCKVSGRLLADGEVSGRHVIRLEVVAPDGIRPSFYARNLEAPGGHFTVSIPFALDELPGRWWIEMTDIASGESASLPIVLSES